MKVCAASSIFPGLKFIDALAAIQQAKDPKWGSISLDHVQLCPQHPDYLTEESIDALKEAYPATQFRPHANVCVAAGLQVEDASTYHFKSERTIAYFERLKELTHYMGAKAWSIHAGLRKHCDMNQMRDNILRIQDDWGIPVAVEGLYVGDRRGESQLMATWEEYKWVKDQGLNYALDLSHLNIVAATEGHQDQLVEELICSEQCLEIHVSENNGRGDWHSVSDKMTWWDPILRGVKLHNNTVLFSEGNLRNPRKA